MQREIQIGKYSKKVQNFHPQLFTTMTLLQKLSYNLNTHFFKSIEKYYQKEYQVYVSRQFNGAVEENVQFITQGPKLLLFKHDPFSLIIEEKYQHTLREYLSLRQQERGLPFINEIDAKTIILELTHSLDSYTENSIFYDCISDANAVRINKKWSFSLAAILSANESLHRQFYDKVKKGEQSIVYALGNLLFKMLFGFSFLENVNKKPKELNFNQIIQFLEQETNKKLLKVYYFALRLQTVSLTCRNFIIDCLSGKIKTLNQFKSHNFFHEPSGNEQSRIQSNGNSQIKMLKYFDKKYHSLVLASIERRKKYPYQRMHVKSQVDTVGFLQCKEMYRKDPILCHFNFGFVPSQSQVKEPQNQQLELNIHHSYFGQNFGQDQNPTRELIRLIETDKKNHPDYYQSQKNRQNQIKMYAFPYMMIFQLAIVFPKQPDSIKKKIQYLVPLLLQVSSIAGSVVKFPILHATQQKYTKFQEIKIKYRELINALYKHFLTEAMKKYNSKRDTLTIQQKIKLKEQGLQYYRLCLKLMETSLIMRKKGKDLDLQRIETSQRKQIQEDLQILLKTYFPNRVEIN